MSKAKKPINNDHVQAAQKKLLAEGYGPEWEIIVANDLELQLDFDGPIPDRFVEVFAIFTEHHPINGFRRTLSRSGKGSHIHILLQHPLEVNQRIAWQACMGSDAVRECLSLISVEKGWLNPILLFEKRDDNG